MMYQQYTSFQAKFRAPFESKPDFKLNTPNGLRSRSTLWVAAVGWAWVRTEGSVADVAAHELIHQVGHEQASESVVAYIQRQPEKVDGDVIVPCQSFHLRNLIVYFPLSYSKFIFYGSKNQLLNKAVRRSRA